MDDLFFKHINGYDNYWYWTSTTSTAFSSRAWIVSFETGTSKLSNNKKDKLHNIRCVRTEFIPCHNGERLKQGTEVCIPGTPAINPGIYLPNCDSGRLVQGTSECNESAIPADPPGFTLPTCDEGRLVQGTSECNATATPTISMADQT